MEAVSAPFGRIGYWVFEYSTKQPARSELNSISTVTVEITKTHLWEFCGYNTSLIKWLGNWASVLGCAHCLISRSTEFNSLLIAWNRRKSIASIRITIICRRKRVRTYKLFDSDKQCVMELVKFPLSDKNVFYIWGVQLKWRWDILWGVFFIQKRVTNIISTISPPGVETSLQTE